MYKKSSRGTGKKLRTLNEKQKNIEAFKVRFTAFSMKTT